MKFPVIEKHRWDKPYLSGNETYAQDWDAHDEALNEIEYVLNEMYGAMRDTVLPMVMGGFGVDHPVLRRLGDTLKKVKGVV